MARVYHAVKGVKSVQDEAEKDEGGETRLEYIGRARERTPSCFEGSSLGDEGVEG